MNNKQRSILNQVINEPDALSLRYIPFFMCLNFPFLLLIDNVWKFSGVDQFRLALAKVTGFCVLFLYFLLIKHLYSEHQRRSLSMPILVILSGLGGAIQGAVSGALLDLLGVKTQFTIFDRSTTAFVVALTWLPANAVAVSALLTFRRNRTEYLRRAETMGRIAFEQAGLAKSIRKNVEKDIVDELKWTREFTQLKFQRSIEEGIQSTNVDSQLMKEYASQDLRAISHTLWNQADTKSKIIEPIETNNFRSFWELYRLSYFLPPVDSLVQIFMVLTIFLPLSLRGYPPSVQLQTAAIFFIVGYGTLRSSVKLYNWFPKWGPLINAFRTFSALFFSILVAVILNNEYILNAPNLPVPRLIAAFIAFVFTDVALAVSKSTLYSQEDQIEALYRSIGRKKAQINLANLEIALISREWAQHIHGALASKLLTAAAILENSIPSQDLVSKEAAILEATHIMNGEFAIPAKRERSLMQEFTHRVHQWSSIINIETHGAVDMHLPSISVEKFGLAVEEALANAFRHGQATKVTIFLKEIDEHSFECLISDNGIGLAEYQRNGLGSSLFEDIAPGNWKRELGADGVGTRLRLLVSAPNNPSVADK